MILQALCKWLLVMPFVHRNEDSTLISTHYNNITNLSYLICIIIISVTVIFLENKLSKCKSKFLRGITSTDCWVRLLMESTFIIEAYSREQNDHIAPPLKQVDILISKNQALKIYIIHTTYSALIHYQTELNIKVPNGGTMQHQSV